MSGIAGFAGILNKDLLLKMNGTMTHRGPDDDGFFIDEQARVSLAIRRLSIIDLETGKQPLSNEDDTLWIVADGKIFNSPEMRSVLMKKGHRFKTNNSDIEVLLHAYEDKGVDMLTDLNGMFAFVIFDKKKRKLFGCRDRLGIKPLYYVMKNGSFAFASELKTLLCLPWVSRDLNLTSIYHYLSLLFVPAPESVFTDIRKVEPGTLFEYSLDTGGFRTLKYWDIDFTNPQNHSIDEWMEIIDDHLKQAIKRWALSDVPIACSLSGGIDSSVIVGYLAKAGNNRIHTYSLGFSGDNEQSYNELPLARLVARRWGTQHQEFIIKPDHILRDINMMVYHLDEPYGGGLPSWYIYKFIAQDMKVCLTGLGGDELFGNYGRWQFMENPLLTAVKSLHSFLRFYSMHELIDGKKYSRGHYYWRYFSDAVKDDYVFLNVQNVREKTESYLERMWEESKARNIRDGVAYVDGKTQLPEEYLLVTDRFSMAHSVEARVPFLDHILVEQIYKIPAQVRTRYRDPKYLLKQTVKALLPSDLLTAPKRGFMLPLKLWTRTALRAEIEEALEPEYLKKQSLFSPQIVNRLVKPHMNGWIEATPQIWALYMFQRWYRTFCDP